MESDDTVFYGVLETADLQACRMEDNALQVRAGLSASTATVMARVQDFRAARR